MSEYHDTGLTREESYAIARRGVNQEYDKRLANKGFFTSRRSIEEERQEALRKTETAFFGERRGGCMTE